jgi:hypothetical protein
MNGKHTPGPWHVIKGLGIGRAATIAEVVVGNGEALKVKAYQDFDVDFDAEADAQLIAAAPELLEALVRLASKTEELVKHLQATDRLRPCFNLPALDAANAAIAKATGSAS